MDIEGYKPSSSCSDCGNVVKLYYYPSNGPIASGDHLDTGNYILIGSAAFNIFDTHTLTFSLGSQYDRFHIAILEENSCFNLKRLQVSYRICPTETTGLIIYPDTPIGASAETVAASCTDGADVSPGSSLSVTCNTDGTFSGSPSCSCSGGYFLSGESCHRKINEYFFTLVQHRGVCYDIICNH